jgi:small subunit ribosomal protein S16
MVVIRLARTGAKKKPFYHIVVADRRLPRDGRYIEKVGYYNPVARGKATRLQLNREQVAVWVAKGAQLSQRVAYLLKAHEKGTLAEAAVNKRPAEAKAAAKEEAKKAEVEAKEEVKAEAKEEVKAEAKTEAKAEDKKTEDKKTEDKKTEDKKTEDK